MKPTELSEYIPTEQEIKNAMDGYFSLTPTERNKYFKEFEKSWLSFQNDIEHYNNGDHGNSYLLILQAGKDHSSALYERCSLKLQEIRNTFNGLIKSFDSTKSKLHEKRAIHLLRILEAWKENIGQESYAICFDYTKKALLYSEYKEMIIGEPFGSYKDFILEVITTIEKCIDQLCTYYAQHLGISCAMTSLLEDGSFPNCKDFVTRDWNGFEFSLEQHKNKSIRNLLNMGHLADPAIKLRFISLVDKDRYSHQEAFEIIESEMKNLGFDTEVFLPEEPKTLSDRARRHRDKIYSELGSLIEN